MKSPYNSIYQIKWLLSCWWLMSNGKSHIYHAGQPNQRSHPDNVLDLWWRWVAFFRLQWNGRKISQNWWRWHDNTAFSVNWPNYLVVLKKNCKCICTGPRSIDKAMLRSIKLHTPTRYRTVCIPSRGSSDCFCFVLFMLSSTTLQVHIFVPNLRIVFDRNILIWSHPVNHVPAIKFSQIHYLVKFTAITSFTKTKTRVQSDRCISLCCDIPKSN